MNMKSDCCFTFCLLHLTKFLHFTEFKIALTGNEFLGDKKYQKIRQTKVVSKDYF